MTDLFDSSTAPAKTEYSAQDIEVLEGLEPVRHRPGMYIGGTDIQAMHHLVAEILDNSTRPSLLASSDSPTKAARLMVLRSPI